MSGSQRIEFKSLQSRVDFVSKLLLTCHGREDQGLPPVTRALSGLNYFEKGKQI